MENLSKTLDNSAINSPILSRSASDEKSEDYMDADDNTPTNTDVSVTKPSKGVNIPNILDPLENPNQTTNYQPLATTSTSTGSSNSKPNFQSVFITPNKLYILM